MNKKDFILIYQPSDPYDVDDGINKDFLKDLNSYTNKSEKKNKRE